MPPPMQKPTEPISCAARARWEGRKSAAARTMRLLLSGLRGAAE
jgi:hypothetical protein